jgi:hypothetical protein
MPSWAGALTGGFVVVVEPVAALAIPAAPTPAPRLTPASSTVVVSLRRRLGFFVVMVWFLCSSLVCTGRSGNGDQHGS